MLKINKRVEYALMALKYMAEVQSKGDEIVSARELCEKFNAPFDTVAKVLQVFNNKGIASSSKGVKGGYALCKPLKEINYNELVIMIEGVHGTQFCSSAKGDCLMKETCSIHTPVSRLNNRLNLFFDKLDLHTLLFGDVMEFKISRDNGENYE